MFKRRGIRILVMVMGFALMTACGGQHDGQTIKRERIGVVISTLNNPFFVDLVEGIKERSKDLPYDLVIFDSQNDPSKELANIEDLITHNVGVILLNPTDSDAVARAVLLAQEANIPVISLDRVVNGAAVTSHIASDNVAGGAMAGRFLWAELDTSLSVVELEGIAGASAARERGLGFNQVVGEYVVVRQVANFDRTQGLNVMENIIQSGLSFNAVFAHNDEMALGALKALQDMGRNDVIVVGFDATNDARLAVQNGSLRATVAQRPEQIGAQGMTVAHNLLNGQTVESYYPVELELVTQ